MRKISTLSKITLLATLFASCVVMLGAWTRLVDAGLGCPDWPGCYGFLTVPQSEQHIAVAQARFPDSPVEVEKGWPEMIHRYFAGTLGLIILGLTIFAYSKRNRQVETPLPKKHTAGLLILVTCQALFGMWTVTLKLWPQVVSAHLLGGFATLALLFLLFLRVHYSRAGPLSGSAGSLSYLKKLGVLALLLVVIQIFLGAWTASNYAALACGDELPGCQGSLWPEMDFATGFNLFQAIGPNYLGGLLHNEARVAIQVAHRVGAILVTTYLLWMAWQFFRHCGVSEIRKASCLMLAALTLQFILGLSNVIWLIPLPVAVAHNAVGALLLLSLVFLNFQLTRCGSMTRTRA